MSNQIVLGGNNDGDDSFPQQKDQHSNKQESSEVNKNPPKSAPLLPIPSAIPINRGTSQFFYKTRICTRFLQGSCRNGDRCTFAHGSKDLREPAPNWQEHAKDNRGGGSGGSWNDDQKIIQRMRICKKFYSGEECPYGDRCNFLHENPAKFRAAGAAMDSRRARESSAINIQTATDHGQTEGGHPVSGSVKNVQVQTASSDLDVTMKGIYRKTRLCSRWDLTGKCIFGDNCHFAHGLTELHPPVGPPEGDVHVHGIPSAASSSVATSSRPNTPMTEAPPTSSGTAAPAGPRGELRGFAKLAIRKLNGIYGDWIDDEDSE